MFQEQYTAHCYSCNRNFYSKTPEKQSAADELKKITRSTEEIAKLLDIKIL
jgi:hypothetical protein